MLEEWSNGCDVDAVISLSFNLLLLEVVGVEVLLSRVVKPVIA